ncbi:hypothetical protein GLAREA_09899 [Glarea lozoyensis ATCC 20868]|uniref:SWI/SNF chromatin-remodeling complex subunit snf5 n=1 Tax=Glarea lozoyensis (strain ATCC 20868 / MF5171) TaxID=1116229 RepID=S3DQP6_GLAL2|nr:uncharacterized protein GLAREA_09899 [Glarea lozoyensis ATCC 20868]EPE28778.1 hypothetical protein GLAREA_09899 [Glarea lozoyensis ATCC 20868]
MAPEPQEPSDVTSADPTTAVSSTLTHRGRTKEDKEKFVLEQMVHRDTLHFEAIVSDQNSRQITYNRRRDEIDDYRNVRGQYRQFFPPRKLYGEGYAGYGNGYTDGPTKLIYPNAKPRLGHRKTPKLRIKRKELAQQADQVEELVPVRLEVDWDKVKLRDTFTWNLHDRTIPPDLFAATLVEDLGLPLPTFNPVLDQVQQQLREQLGDFYPQVYIEEDALDPELPYSAYKNEEMRILIKLNITIGAVTLEDKFEWEINNPMNSPEEFARSMTRELHLAGEFTTAIAHCIREQSQLFTRSLFIVGHPFDGRPLEDADLIASFLPSPLPSVLRPQQQAREYAPYLYELSEVDLERSEVIYSREQRRQKRSVNRRGGPTLPDLKDRQRTVRTLVVSKTLPGAADTVEESRLFKKVAVGRGKKGLQGGDLTESSDSEDSSPESPAMSNLPQGTARTRGMRGAATAAQQRMANIGRSETPEASLAHHHETRTSARRYGGRDVREESVDNTTLIVKLKVGRERLRKWSRELKARSQAPQTPSLSRAPSAAAVTPAPGTMGPPTTPGLSSQTLHQPPPPTPSPAPVPQGQIGRVEAPPPPPPGQAPPPPPPPPEWLAAGLEALRQAYPGDRFESVMKHLAVNKTTDLPMPAPPPDQADTVKWMYLPRIRCQDCPGKLYTPGPEETVNNFEVHLKNRAHREKVDARIAGKK